LKEGLIESAILHGRDGKGRDGLVGFLVHLAVNHPRTHGGLLAKLLPLQINSDVKKSSVSSIRIVTVPSGTFLTKKDIEDEHARNGTLDLLEANEIADTRPMTIEHSPPPAPIEIEIEQPEPVTEPSVMQCAIAMGYTPLPPRNQRG
jgi:hypothetical protein